MFRKISSLVCAAAMIVMAGCIDATTVLKVKKDGSGVIVESVYFGKGFIKMMEQMTAQMGAAMGGAPSTANKPFDPPLEVEKYKSKASLMGEGVTYQSSKKVQKSDGSQGIQIVYGFTDVNKVKLSSQPDTGAPGPGAGADQEVKDPITFKMAKTGKPKLVILMPKPDPAKASAGQADVKGPDGKAPEMPPEQMKEMKQMFDGLRMRMAIMVDGKITKSNATYQEKDKDGNSHIVTIFDMNFGKLINDDAAFKKIAAMGNMQDMATAKEKLKGIEGIRIETNDKVEVEFE